MTATATLSRPNLPPVRRTNYDLAKDWANGEGRWFAFSYGNDDSDTQEWMECKARTANSRTFGAPVPREWIFAMIVQYLEEEGVSITERRVREIEFLARHAPVTMKEGEIR
jgi:hypothetical protein